MTDAPAPFDTLLMGEHLRRAAARAPDKTAIIMGRAGDARRIRYAELDADADRVANALLRAGVGKGEHIATLSPTLPETPSLFYGAARSGAVALILSIRLTADDVARMIAAAELKLIFVGPGMADTALAGRIISGRPVRLVFVGMPAPAGMEDVVSLEEFLDGAPALPPRLALAPDDVFSIILSGGTTGIPKMIQIDHRAASLWSIGAAQGFDLEGDDIFGITVPLFHGAGLLVWFATAVMLGGTCVLTPGWDPAEFVGLVRDHGITAAILVPTQISDLIRSDALDLAALASLKKVNHPGMPMKVALIEQAVAALPHVEFTDNYGSSECGPMAARPHRYLPEKAHCVGQPLYTVDLAVIDADGRRLPPGETGEIAARGPIVMRGYFKDPDSTAAAKRPGGWHATGDVGYFDGDGFLVLVDRAKDVIVAGGENIYPNEIEAALYAHPAVAEAAAFGIPDDHWGELPAAHVVVKAGETVDVEALTEFVAGRIPKHKRPRLIEFVDALPKSGVGKILKNEIRAPYWEGRERNI